MSTKSDGLPGELVGALATNRPELLLPLVASLARGDRLFDAETQVRALRVIADLIEEREAMRVRLQQTEITTKEALQNIRGAANKLEQIVLGYSEGEEDLV